MMIPGNIHTHFLEKVLANKLETFEDALFESGKTSTHKTEKLAHLTYSHAENGMRKWLKFGNH